MLKANERIGQAQQGERAMSVFVPADQEPSEMIEPSIQGLDDPVSRRLARLWLTEGQLLGGGGLTMIGVPPVGAHMYPVAHLLSGFEDLGIVITRIQA